MSEPLLVIEPSVLRLIAESFASYHVQTIYDIVSRTKLPTEVVKSVLNELLESEVVYQGEIEEQVTVYWTWNVGPNAHEKALEQFRQSLAPNTALQESELKKAREEAKRIENAILVLKMRIQNHPNVKSLSAGADSRNSDRTPSVDQAQLEIDIRKLEQEISRYASVAKLVLDDVADIYGALPREVLQRLGATRSVQNLLL